jgi:glycosyltransferase involved in cell wall biosynthesis
LGFLFKNNKKVFLLSAGDDYMYVKYNFEHPENPSIIQPYRDGKIPDKEFSNVLKYRRPAFKKLHQYIQKNIRGVIATDIDYHIPMLNNDKYIGLIPSPMNLDNFPKEAININEEIIIFHGINRESYYKKGNDFFEIALIKLKQKFGKKIKIIVTENIPYDEYTRLYNQAHIIVDQLYGHDQGSNALEAMAKSKAVITNASVAFQNLYNLSEKVAINGLPDVDYLVSELSFLIENPDEIKAIGKRARIFIEKEHDYIEVAKKYVELWSSF